MTSKDVMPLTYQDIQELRGIWRCLKSSHYQHNLYMVTATDNNGIRNYQQVHVWNNTYNKSYCIPREIYLWTPLEVSHENQSVTGSVENARFLFRQLDKQAHHMFFVARSRAPKFSLVEHCFLKLALARFPRLLYVAPDTYISKRRKKPYKIRKRGRLLHHFLDHAPPLPTPLPAQLFSFFQVK
jgi:hypothetical protein